MTFVGIAKCEKNESVFLGLATQHYTKKSRIAKSYLVKHFGVGTFVAVLCLVLANFREHVLDLLARQLLIQIPTFLVKAKAMPASSFFEAV